LSVTTPTGGTSCANETTSTTTYTYDADSNQLTVVISPPPLGQSYDVTTTSTYDADSELCWSDVAVVSSPSCGSAPTGAGTETTTHSYNADGQQMDTIPPVGNVSGSPSNYATTSIYNGVGELTSQSAPAASGSGVETTTTYYDADGNTIAVTGPNGNPGTCNPVTTSGCADTTYNMFDQQNRELSTTDPSSDETQYTYDADGTYNGAGQVIQISYTDGTPTVSYQYTSGGEVCWMYQGSSTNSCSSPPSGATTYSYDSNGRLVSTTNAAGATVTYGYDASSNVACVSYPNGSGNTCSSSGTPTGVVRYSYNQANQLTSLTDWVGDTLTFTYNTEGQQCWVSTYAPSTPTCASPPHQSGAVTTDYSYDTLGNVSGLETTTGTGATNLLNLVIASRNADEYILSETPTVGTTTENTDSYSYNQTSQVSSGPITGSSGSTSYAYLPTGSITADTTVFQSAAYTAAGALCWTYTGMSSNACSSPPTGATTYSTNSSGERAAVTPSTGNPASYGWETETNRLTCVNTNGTTCSTSSPTSSTTVYTYDGNGLRSSATIASTTTNFTWGTVGGSSALLSDGTWDYVYAGGAAPIEQIATSGSSPTTDLLLSDESGNVRGLVQLSSGTHQDQLVNYTDYDAYGRPITESAGAVETGGLTTPQTGLNSNFVGSTPWGFGEGYTDPTDLIYLISRYYDPATGQLLSVDPAVALTLQPYTYAADNPTAGTDPSGDFECDTVPEPSCLTEVQNNYEGSLVNGFDIYTFFSGLDIGGLPLSPDQAAGITGAIIEEDSGISSCVGNGKVCTTASNPQVYGNDVSLSYGFGIAQWTSSQAIGQGNMTDSQYGGLVDLLHYAYVHGEPGCPAAPTVLVSQTDYGCWQHVANDIHVQLKFLASELQPSGPWHSNFLTFASHSATAAQAGKAFDTDVINWGGTVNAVSVKSAEDLANVFLSIQYA
jgi:RHS repeat-associated protein